jgi:hypothetical protein
MIPISPNFKYCCAICTGGKPKKVRLLFIQFAQRTPRVQIICLYWTHLTASREAISHIRSAAGDEAKLCHSRIRRSAHNYTRRLDFFIGNTQGPLEEQSGPRTMIAVYVTLPSSTCVACLIGGKKAQVSWDAMNSTYHSESGEWHNAIQRHTANTVSRCCVVQPKFMIWIPIRSDDPWTFGKSSQRGLPLHSAVATSSIHKSLIRLDCYYPIGYNFIYT